MKKIILAVAAAVILLVSCKEHSKPTAEYIEGENGVLYLVKMYVSTAGDTTYKRSEIPEWEEEYYYNSYKKVYEVKYGIRDYEDNAL
jgi:hypothetical protein